jgi:hypothetical protein
MATSVSSAASSDDPLAALAAAEQARAKGVAQQARSTPLSHDMTSFRIAVAQASSVASLLKNPTVLRVLLTAHDLADQTGNPALAQKALLSDPNNAKSTANTQTDTRWKAAAAAYDFFDKGLGALRNSKTLTAIGDAYAQAAWLKSLDQTSPGLSSAITFKQQASSITSVTDIAGNPVYRDVMETALGIAPQIAAQAPLAQQLAISGKLKISQLQDSKFVASLADRYLLIKNGDSVAAATARANKAVGLHA